MTIKSRLLALELYKNTEPMLTLDVDGHPSPEQLDALERAHKSGRRLVVFYEPGNTAWLAGASVLPPWEQ